MLFGAVNLLRKRKGDKPHKLIGYVWVVAMYLACISSFWIRQINDGGFSWIHGLSIFTTFTLSLGLYSAIKGNIEAHKGHMTGSYFGLLGAFLGVVVFPTRLIPQLALHDPLRLVLVMVAIGLSGYFFVRAALSGKKN
jgi:uncharacterized membrane protein